MALKIDISVNHSNLQKILEEEMTIQAQEYWNKIGSKKEFEDPLYLDRLSPFITKQSIILEYGCGYGRLMNLLEKNGYENLIGFDFAPNMIARGKNTHPSLDLRLLDEPNLIPCPDESIDVVIMSTVLCCMIHSKEHVELIGEIFRVLRNGGVFYLSDFLICQNEKYLNKYLEGFQSYGIHGVYTSNENLTVRHLTSQYVFDLLRNFDVQWFEQFDFKTMNNNPARTFHCIGKKMDAR